jgi:hypothetical protein
LNLLIAFSVFLQRVGKTGLGPVNICAVVIPNTVQKIHIAMLAAFAGFDTAVPGIPNIMQEALPVDQKLPASYPRQRQACAEDSFTHLSDHRDSSELTSQTAADRPCAQMKSG